LLPLSASQSVLPFQMLVCLEGFPRATLTGAEVKNTLLKFHWPYWFDYSTGVKSIVNIHSYCLHVKCFILLTCIGKSGNHYWFLHIRLAFPLVLTMPEISKQTSLPPNWRVLSRPQHMSGIIYLELVRQRLST
jgi:hypothetical protein